MVGQPYCLARLGDPLRGSVLGGNLLRARLRDVPVLAEFAVDVAAGRGQREGQRPGQVVKQRLLLDGIDVRRAYPRMHQRVVGSAAIFAHSAVAALAVAHRAFARAQLALDLPIRQLLVELGFDDELRIVLFLLAAATDCTAAAAGQVRQLPEPLPKPGRTSGTNGDRTSCRAARSRDRRALSPSLLRFTKHIEPPSLLSV